MDSYLKMMKHMADLYRQYAKKMVDCEADTADFAAFIEDLSEPQFHKMMTGIPALFGAVTDPLFLSTFSLKNLQQLSEGDDRWAKVLAASRNMPLPMDLTNPDQERQVFGTADLLLSLYPLEDELCRVDSHLVNEQRQHPVLLHLASKLALSKMFLNLIPSPLFISFIVPMYKENNRIRTLAEHPSGEDFLRRKVYQLKWLFDENGDKTWELVFVDDGCPENSGDIAEEIIRQEGYKQARVLHLADGIAQGVPVTKGMLSTDDSQKGGAIQYGMWSVLQNRQTEDGHVIVLTDSDLSTNIAQAGLLLRGLEEPNRVCVIGTRYSADGVYCTPEGAAGLTRYDRMMLVFRHFIRSKLLPQLGEIIDTQCGFKAFKSEVLEKVLHQMTDRRFSFDMELLLLIALHCGQGDHFLGEAPIVWIESNEESNFYTLPAGESNRQ
ncbi:MAG: hypothetical protein JSW04_11670 [Desulfobacterales bacterium]|nr:MAG: hypothetical protein JSW04_11670 [Desulfobacterales bacterium]